MTYAVETPTNLASGDDITGEILSPSNMPRCIAVNVFNVSDYLFIAFGQF